MQRKPFSRMAGEGGSRSETDEGLATSAHLRNHPQMPRRPTAKVLPFARTLRRNMTNAEAQLWRMLRDRRLDDLKFRRQAPIGRYIADFLCEERKLIVELDGAPHDHPVQQAHDAARDEWLRGEGYIVLRMPNDFVIGGGEMALALIRSALKRM